jgi:hypothetical protein
MKTEYLVECYDNINNNDFFLIVTLKNKKTFFVGIFKKTEKEMIRKEIFNIFVFKEYSNIEQLKRKRKPVSLIFSYRNSLAEMIRRSPCYKKTEKLIFIK